MNKINKHAYLIPLLLGIIGIFFNAPLSSLPNHYPELAATWRISFSLLYIWRIVQSWDAAPLLHGWKKTKWVKLTFIIQILLSLLLLTGTATFFTSIGLFVITLALFRQSRYYSVEDVLYQHLLFFLPWLDTGQVWSIDTLFHLSPQQSVLPALNAFFWAMGLYYFSAGLEKCRSPIWQKGQGFFYFIALPHLVRPWFKWLRNHRPLCKGMSWATVCMELLFLPSLLFQPLAIISHGISLGFAIGLLTLVDFSFIGQALGLVSLWFLALLMAPGALSSLQTPQPWLWLGLWITWSLSLSTHRSVFLNSVNRITTGITNIGVFTEQHLTGIYVYQLRAQNQGAEWICHLNAFNQSGELGTYQKGYPRYYQGAMYPITDLCLARQHAFKLSKEMLLEDLCWAAYLVERRRKKSLESIHIYLKAINPSPQEPFNNWISQEWAEMGSCSGSNPAWQWSQTVLPASQNSPRLKRYLPSRH
jgi:hypothetical protein